MNNATDSHLSQSTQSELGMKNHKPVCCLWRRIYPVELLLPERQRYRMKGLSIYSEKSHFAVDLGTIFNDL
jgi:hypothetical protein